MLDDLHLYQNATFLNQILSENEAQIQYLLQLNLTNSINDLIQRIRDQNVEIQLKKRELDFGYGILRYFQSIWRMVH